MAKISPKAGQRWKYHPARHKVFKTKYATHQILWTQTQVGILTRTSWGTRQRSSERERSRVPPGGSTGLGGGRGATETTGRAGSTV